MQVIVVRNMGSDNRVLLPLASIMASHVGGAYGGSLVLVDGSEAGVTPQVNDVLSMMRVYGRQVVVVRAPPIATAHNKMLALGLRMAVALGATRVHHFDDDVVVMAEWWQEDWRRDCVQTMQLMEADPGIKGFALTEAGDKPYVSAAGFTLPAKFLTSSVLTALEEYGLGVFEDVRLCKLLGLRCTVVAQIGLMHSTRETGGGYVGKVVEELASGRLLYKHS